jgi:hypothetical protein
LESANGHSQRLVAETAKAAIQRALVERIHSPQKIEFADSRLEKGQKAFIYQPLKLQIGL